MNDIELAEEIEQRLADGVLTFTFNFPTWRQIIAALRRVPSDDPMSSNYIPLCAGHAETWFTGRDHLKGGMKATCVVCAFERPPSGEMVMVDRNTLGLAHTWLRAAIECKEWHWDGDQHEAATEIADELKQLLSAVKAEGRKS